MWWVVFLASGEKPEGSSKPDLYSSIIRLYIVFYCMDILKRAPGLWSPYSAHQSKRFQVLKRILWVQVDVVNVILKCYFQRNWFLISYSIHFLHLGRRHLLLVLSKWYVTCLALYFFAYSLNITWKLCSLYLAVFLQLLLFWKGNALFLLEGPEKTKIYHSPSAM